MECFLSRSETPQNEATLYRVKIKSAAATPWLSRLADNNNNCMVVTNTPYGLDTYLSSEEIGHHSS
jgi:hypothetical protein